MSALPYYETDRAVSEYLLLHYGAGDEVFPHPFGARDGLDFARRCVAEGFAGADLAGAKRALDLGCAVGRAAFELARHVPAVVGIDFSAKFIAAAETIRRARAISYARWDEGDRTTQLAARLPDGIEPERVAFERGDALRLRPGLGAFDVVLAANLLCRVPQPAALLESLAGRVNPGGWLLLTTPFTWLAEYTAREEWLGGTPAAGSGSEAVARLLAPAFELVRRRDMPFLIREHARKFQYGIAEATLWRRRAP